MACGEEELAVQRPGMRYETRIGGLAGAVSLPPGKQRARPGLARPRRRLAELRRVKLSRAWPT
eukprot:6861973-Alexandrium_andersonii.AAC.1